MEPTIQTTKCGSIIVDGERLEHDIVNLSLGLLRMAPHQRARASVGSLLRGRRQRSGDHLARGFGDRNLPSSPKLIGAASRLVGMQSGVTKKAHRRFLPAVGSA
jgi:hypothetical protein